MLDNVRKLVEGKKTYIVCVLAILTALLGWANGDINSVDLIKAIFTATGAITLRAGISKSKTVAVVFAALLLGSSLQAQDTAVENKSVVPPVVSKDIPNAINGVLNYLLEHGTVGTGYGTELSAGKEVRGPTLNYNLELPVGFNIGETKVRLGLSYNTTFSEPVNYQHLCLSVPIYKIQLPQVIGDTLNTPKEAVTKAGEPIATVGKIWPSLDNWRIQPAIGLRPEDIANLQFNWRRVYVGVELQVKF